MRLVVIALALLTLAGCGEPDRPSIPLALAVSRGDIDQLERHMYWGSDMETVNADGQRPLHVAAVNGNVVMVELLLDHGVQIDAPDAHGNTALALAVLRGRTQTAELMLKRGATLHADALLLQAARTGNPDRDVIRFLASRGADLETRDANGDTALLLAVKSNHLRLARHLVDVGADVNATDASGRSALAIAKAANASDMVALLTRYGAR